MARDERGSVLPLMVVAVLLVGAIVVLIGRLGSAATDRAAARAAADAAALAGAADGEASARELAEANGAELTSFEVKGADALVEVRLGAARAVGRARRSAGGMGAAAAGGGGDERMAPAMRAALGRAGQLLGRDVPVADVQPPGLAVDVPTAIVDQLAGVAPSAGLCRPNAESRPTLFEVCHVGGGDP
ncbi:MAG TPA: pilus assembly protein TadG-related protein [Acidimicrobiales bacterium]|nr:pilus assembly protein TadG-related protein [Acidimicrobiales bacterium]